MLPPDTPDDDDDQISGLLDDLEALLDEEEEVSLGEIIDALGARGFGPLLVTLSAFLIMPVGMIPGMPGLVAIVLVRIGLQMLIGQKRLWAPVGLRRRLISADLLRASVKRARPLARRLRPVLMPRYCRLVDNGLTLTTAAAIFIATGAVIFLIGFIPGLPFVLSIHVLLIGLGMSARDGIVTLLGFAAIAPAFWLLGKFLL
ncbi:MAG: exopolysaccharide biosynthesis protein [Paracoccaceae bacterium]